MVDLENKIQDNEPVIKRPLSPDPPWFVAGVRFFGFVGGAVLGGVVTSLVTGDVGYSGVGAYVGLCVGAGVAGALTSNYSE